MIDQIKKLLEADPGNPFLQSHVERHIVVEESNSASRSAADCPASPSTVACQQRMKESEWVKKAHQCKGWHFEARSIDPEHFGYRAGNHPVQVCITASGWPAKLLRWVFRIKPVNFTGTNLRYWPHDDLM